MIALAFRPALLKYLPYYRAELFRADLLSGLTVGIVALPLAMAFAIASGVPPQSGLFTAILAGFLISALGGTRLCIGGPTGAFVVILAGIGARYGVANLFVCTALAGLMLIGMGLLRMGQLIKFFPMPLITGFTNGIALVIMLTQIKDFFGLAIGKIPPGFFPTVHTLWAARTTVHPPTLMLAAVCLALILGWPKKLNRLLPSPFVALVAGTLITALLNDRLHLGLSTIGSRFGGIPQGFPAFIGLALDFTHLSDLISPAFTIALLGAIESLLCAVAADQLTGDKHDANQELLAQGIANLVVPLFGGIAATGAIARTATNIQNGGRTPIAGLVHATLLLIVMLVAAPLARHIPLATLAAILMAVGLKMGDWDIRKAWRFPKRDTAILATTFALTVIFDLTVAVQIGLLIAAALFVSRMSTQTALNRLMPEHAILFERQSIAGKSVPVGAAAYRLEGALFFGSVDKLDTLLTLDVEAAKVLILQLHRVVLMDTTGLLTLQTLSEKLASRGQTLLLCGASEAHLDMLRNAGVTDAIGADRVLPDLARALGHARDLLSERPAGHHELVDT